MEAAPTRVNEESLTDASATLRKHKWRSLALGPNAAVSAWPCGWLLAPDLTDLYVHLAIAAFSNESHATARNIKHFSAGRHKWATKHGEGELA